MKILLHRRRYICFIIYCVSLFGCAGISGHIRLYEGPKKTDDEIARFLVPSELELVAINGVELKAPYVPDSHYQVELLPGDHQIMVLYSEYWGDPTGGSLVVSDVFYLQITVVSGSTYMFKHNGPEDLMNVDILVSDIKIWLEQPKTGQTIEAVSRSVSGIYFNRTIRQIATGKEAGKLKEVVDSSPINSEKQTPAKSQLPTDQDTSSTLIAE